MKVSLYIVLGLFLSLPLMFNACQQGFQVQSNSVSLGSKEVAEPTESLREKYCSQILGLSSKLQPSSNVFAKGKVTQNLKSEVARQKSGEKDMEFVVLIYNNCLKSGSKQNGLSSLITGNQEPVEGMSLQSYTYTLPASMSMDTFSRQVEADDCIRGVALNGQARVFRLEGQFNDILVRSLDHLEAINAAKAYEIIYNPVDGIPKVSDSLRDAHISVVDTGVDVNHPDLTNNIFKFRLPNDGNNIYRGVNATTLRPADANGDQVPIDWSAPDMDGHGTHVAGLIGAEANNGIGVVGVMPYRAKLMAVKTDVFINSDVEGIESYWQVDSNSIINGIIWSAAQGADVINLSVSELYESQYTNDVMKDAIQQVIGAGVTVVTVAGNMRTSNNFLDGTNLSVIPALYGSSIEGLITVGASNTDDKNISYFSVRNPRLVEIAAPGNQSNSGNNGLVSTVPAALENNSYAAKEGTSMSAPLVSGAAGMIVLWHRLKTGMSPHPCVVEGIIKESAERVPALTQHIEEGRHLDLHKMAQKLKEIWP